MLAVAVLDEAGRTTTETPPAEVARLPVSGAVEGRVLWLNGQLVSEASLHFRPLPKDASNRPPPRRGVDPWEDVGVTEGRFRIEGVSEGSYLVVASRSVHYPEEEHLDASIKTGWWLAITELRLPREEPLDLTLAPMGSVRGRVSGPDGRGLKGFSVQAVPLNIRGAVDDVRRRLEHDWGFNSQDGTFEFVGLLPGEWQVSVMGDECAAPVPKRIEVPWEESLDFELARLVELNGRIVDSVGEHLRAEARAKWSETGGSIAAGSDSDRAWGNGLFRLHVPPTIVELQASFEGRVSEPVVLDTTTGRARDDLLLVVPGKQ